MDLSKDDLGQIAEADRRAVDPPIPVDTATWSKAGQLDWWVEERGRGMCRVRGADGRQRWIRAVVSASRERLTVRSLSMILAIRTSMSDENQHVHADAGPL